VRKEHKREVSSSSPDRREFLSSTSTLAGALFFGGLGASSVIGRSKEAAIPAPIPEPHFPSQMHLFVWRNWELANIERIAEVLGASEDQVVEIGRQLGLPSKPQLSADQLRRIYITVIRQNWHVLPESQLIRLLGWDREHFDFTLREDDFLSEKLGPKPHCEPVTFSPVNRAIEERLRWIRKTIKSTFGDNLFKAGESPFHFIGELADNRIANRFDPSRKPKEDEVDLNGWVIEVLDQSNSQIRSLAEELHNYLVKAYDCRISLSSQAKGPAIRVLTTADASVDRDSFEIAVKADVVEVRARDSLGLQQGVYYLEKQMERAGAPVLPIGTTRQVRRISPAFLYSYFALYGDPLMEAAIDPFPDGYLEKLSRLGVNGIWLQAILRNLAPSRTFPEFGQGWQTRLATLRRLVDRAGPHGIKVYLYINEPRAMPEEFFRRRPELKGTPDPSDPRFSALCTSALPVRQWLKEGLAHVFREVPTLGGIFSITMSENLTNCFSKSDAQSCPRCSKRNGADVVAEVIQAFREGVRQSAPDAEVIAWDWGWGLLKNGVNALDVIQQLPHDVKLQSVSEWGKKVVRGGFESTVGEYSMSVVGPGPRAVKNWTAARRRHLQTMAKLQINCTWELSAVPYIPALNLVQRHLENMVRDGVNGLMLSWTVGGYPSPNLEVAGEYCRWPTPERDQVLRDIAIRRYGEEAAQSVLEAWRLFSAAFQEFPYGIALYLIPTQHGPANPLRLERSGQRARMILFPYDDVKAWCGPYPVEVVERQFSVMSAKWQTGLQEFHRAVDLAGSPRRTQLTQDLGIAEACYLHSQSVANQIRFYVLRDDLHTGRGDRSTVKSRMTQIAKEEIELAKRLFKIARDDSRIGFEASNHYYYRPLDLAEKVLNCQDVIRRLEEQQM